MASNGERINARGADIAPVVVEARAALRGGTEPSEDNAILRRTERMTAALLLVMLDVRSLLDRVDSGVRGDGR